MHNKVLSMITTIFKIGFGVAAGGAAGYKIATDKLTKQHQEEIAQKDARISKFYDYFQVTNRWLEIKNTGKTLEAFFDANNMNTIAIYGMGELGHRLYEELKDSNVKVKYAIDKSCKEIDIPVINLEDKLEPVDVIIVTPIFDYNNIANSIANVCDYEIASLEEVVFFED